MFSGLSSQAWLTSVGLHSSEFDWDCSAGKQRNLLRDFILGTLGKEILELKFVGRVFEKDKLVLLFSQLCYLTFLLIQHTINQTGAHLYLK